jgi:hypothetical protein
MTAQREHGSRVRYVLGPDEQDRAGRPCRCDACRAANRVERQRQNRLKAYGRWQPFVDAEPVREHIAMLAEAGIGRRRLGELAGVSDAALRGLIRGLSNRAPTKRVRPETAEAILAVRPGLEACAPRARVNATGTHRRAQALTAIGWPQPELARRLSMTTSNFRTMLRQPSVSAATARAIVRLYGDLWDQKPSLPEADVTRAQELAAQRGWPPPLAWDDDAIDDPAAEPAKHWRRKRLTSAELADEAHELMTSQGYTRAQAAERLDVTVAALGKAFARSAERAPDSDSTQEGTVTPLHDHQAAEAAAELAGREAS